MNDRSAIPGVGEILLFAAGALAGFALRANACSPARSRSTGSPSAPRWGPSLWSPRSRAGWPGLSAR